MNQNKLLLILQVFFGFYFIACLHCPPAFAASFQGLGDLPGGFFRSQAHAVSADGSVVVGVSKSFASGFYVEAFRWTESTGMVGLGDLPGGIFGSYAYAVSADGSTIVGYSNPASGYEAFRWMESTGMVGLGYLPGGDFGDFAYGYGVSANGSVIVGGSTSAASAATCQLCNESFRWTESTGMVGLGESPGGGFHSTAYAVSADGSVVVGYSYPASGYEAFRWTEGTGMIGLGDLPGGNFFSSANAVSADGSVIVGYSQSSSGTQAFRWTESTGMVGLGDLPGGDFSSNAEAISADGSVVVGVGKAGLGDEAFIWDEDNGIRSLKSVLESGFGLDLTNWSLLRAMGVSADGYAIIGWGTNPNGNTEAWIARLDFDKIEVIDPACGSQTECDGEYLLNLAHNDVVIIDDSSIEDLVDANVARSGIVTDGVSQLLVRVRSDEPVTFSLKDAQGQAVGDGYGTLSFPGGSQEGSTVTIDPIETSKGKYVLAAYHAPQNFPGHSLDVLNGLEIKIVAQSSTGRELEKSLQLLPPPIVLVHGVWSGYEAWEGLDEQLSEAGFRVCDGCRLDYGLFTPAGSFDPQVAAHPVRTLIRATDAALRQMRLDGIAATQVDVVGHSMGGLVARSRVAAEFNPYKTLGNYNQGSFHKIITVGTPHLGSPFADFLVANKCDRLLIGVLSPRLETFLEILGKPVGPAIFGFQTSSLALENIGETQVPSHAIVGLEPALSGTEALLNFLIWESGHPLTSVDSLLDEGGNNHDTIVPLASQKGSLSSLASETMDESLVHASLTLNTLDTAETKSQEVWNRVEELLLVHTQTNAFDIFPTFVATGTPLTPEQTQCPPLFRRSMARSASAALTPAPDTEVLPGQTINLTLTITNGNAIDGAIFIVGDKAEIIEGAGPFVLSYEVPSNKAGIINIEAHTFGPGPENYSAETSLNIDINQAVIFLSVSPSFVSFSNIGDLQSIRVTGSLDDLETTIDLTHSSTGTVYSTLSGTEDVVAVSPDGLIEAKGPGEEAISITHFDQLTEVTLEVVPEQHLALNQGWNMASVYIHDETKTVDQLKRELSLSGVLWMWDIDAQRWRVVPDDEALQPGTGYWLKSSAARSTARLAGNQSAYAIALKVGWNFIGAPDRPIRLSELEGSELILGTPWGWNTQNQRYQQVAQDQLLQPGSAYWVYAKQTGTLRLTNAQPASRNHQHFWSVDGHQTPLDPSQYMTTDSPQDYESNACFDARDYAETWSTKDDGDTYAYWVATNSIDPSKAYSYYGGKDDSYTSWEVAKSASTIADTTCQSGRYRRVGRRWYRSQGTIGGYGLIRKDDNQGHVILSQDDQMYSKNTNIRRCYRPRQITNGEERRYRDKRRWRSRYWRRRGHSSSSKTYTIHHAAYGQSEFRYLCDTERAIP